MKKISRPTIERISRYYRDLKLLHNEGGRTVSSHTISDMSGVTPAQVRKDLSYFGKFGKRGVGYPVNELLTELQGLLGLDREWSMALIGVGNIGAALFKFKEFRDQGYHIRAIFDNDPEKIGKNLGSCPILGMSEFNEVVRSGKIEIAIIAVPAENAQEIVDRVVSAGIKGILNFAPKKIFVPEGFFLRNAYISIELEGITFHLTENSKNEAG